MAAPKTQTDTPVPIPPDLRGAHECVRNSRERLKGRRADATGRIEMRWRIGCFGLLVSRDHVRRALLMLHALTAEAARRGMDVQQVDREGQSRICGAGIGEKDHVTLVEVHEQTDRLKLTPAEIAAWKEEHYFGGSWGRGVPTHRHVANGKLKVQLPERWDKHRAPGNGWQRIWSDGARAPVEAKLDSVLRALGDRAAADAVQAAEIKERQRQVRDEEADRQRRYELAGIEDERASRLQDEITAWRWADEVRHYVDHLRQRLPTLEGDEPARIGAWCDWAERRAAAIDPLANLSRVASGLELPYDVTRPIKSRAAAPQ